MDSTQKTLFIAIVLPLSILVLAWWYDTFIRCNESFSPFKNTGGIPSEYSGYVYLDEYNTQQYYKMNPWIYPTPTSYIRQLYAAERNLLDPENLKK